MENNTASQGNEDSIWDDDKTFFGIESSEVGFESIFSSADDEKPVPEDTEEKKPTEEIKVQGRTSEEKPETYFEEDEEEGNNKPPSIKSSEEGKPTEDPEEQEEDKKLFTTLALELKEKGIFREINIDKDKELTEEEFFKAQDLEIETRANEIAESFVKDLDQDAKDFLMHKQAGGSTEAFLDRYYNNFIPELDMKNEKHQEEAVAQYMMQITGETDRNEIENQIQYLKDGGKLADKANKYYAKLQEIDQDNKESVRKQAELNSLKSKQEREKIETEIKDTVTSLEQVGDFSFTNVDKKGLSEFILKPTIKIAEGRYITPMQKKINEVYKDPDRTKLALLAKLLMSDFDVKDIIIKNQTDKVAQAKSKIATIRSGVTPTKNQRQVKSLADLF